jgi:ABC-type proline/glycine betaine transport system substrate-binding protein
MKLYELFEKKKPKSVSDLEKDLKNPYSYTAIGDMMKTIARNHNITPKKLHDQFVDEHGDIPDDWIKKLTKNKKIS